MFFNFLARIYTAGKTIGEAEPKIQRLLDCGFSVTSDLLGEFVREPEKIKTVIDEYKAHIDFLGSIKKKFPEKEISLSIKPSRIGLEMNALFFQKNLMALAAEARKKGVFIWLDAEKKKDREMVLGTAMRLGALNYRNIGAALQCVHSDAKKYLPELLEKGVALRLVKGAYTDGDLSDREAVNENFRKIFWTAIHYYKNSEKKAVVAVATHDERLINYALMFRGDKEIGKLIQIQMLYNIRKKLQTKLASALRYNLLVYVPWGSDTSGFLKRRLAEGIRPGTRWLFIRNIWEAWWYG